MKITYYTYFVKKGNRKYHFNIHPILNHLAQTAPPEFKNSFFYASNQLFLFKRTNNIFLFVITKNSEIIKAIDSETANYTDIYQKLESNEQLGFASYLYVDKYFYGIGSTFYGPKNTIWLDFINQLFHQLNVGHCKFDSSPLPTRTTREEVLNMSFVGRTTLELDISHSITQQIKGLFAVDVNEVDSFEITIKPKSRRSMKKTFSGLCQKVPYNDNIKKYLVKAKAEMEDSLKDFYIVGKGYASDAINAVPEDKICLEIHEKVRNNIFLQNKIHEFANDERFIPHEITELEYYHNVDIWRDGVLRN